MVKKVLFVNGPSQDPSDRFFGWPTSLLYAVAPTIQAVTYGELTLEYDPKFFEPLWYVEGRNDEQIKAEFRERIVDIDIVCGSAIYDSIYPTLQLFAEAKKLNPNIVTILGGPHFDEVHTLPLNNAHRNRNLIDFEIAGDGEYALKAVLECIVNDDLSKLDPNSIPGRAWIYHNGKQYATNGGPLLMDTLPFMPVELVDTKRHKNDFDIFRDDFGEIFPTVQMIAMRGCPYTCDFCSERSELAYPNGRSIDNILEEIEMRKQQGFKAIFFDDSTFGAYRSKQGNISDLLQALSQTGMKFGCLNRFNHLQTSRSIQPYVEAGFDYVYCAIEQFDDSALREMSKGQQKSQIAKSMKQLDQHGLKVGVSLLYGFPFETDDSIRATLDYTQKWVQNGTIVLVSESALSYHPGTPTGKGQSLNFVRTPPNIGHPFNRFEEGQWYHPKHVTAPYLDNILEMSEARFKEVMVRHRHSWHADQGYLLNGPC